MLALGIFNVIGVIAIKKTGDFIHLEREYIVVNLKLRIDFYKYQVEKNNTLLKSIRQMLEKNLLNDLIPKMEEALDSPVTGTLEAYFFRIFFDDQIFKGREIVQSEKKIITKSLTVLTDHMDGNLSFDKFNDSFDMSLNKLIALDEKLNILDKSISGSVHNTLLILTLTLVFITFLAVRTLLTYVRNSVNRFNTKLKDVAQGEGDLTVEMPTDSADTFGMLSVSFNLFVGKMKVLIQELKESVSHVQESSKGITDFTNNSSKD
ncbi:MAG: methyl-accepting chemotaxis protein, partial [Spirochaetota bacterium]|nr:methyl-accepting chemotaxis protein [Spirochaetota bacterium]